jgi:hypothetical protein
MTRAQRIALAYAAVGVVMASRAAPLSFPFGRNALLVTAAWPLFLLADAQHKATGTFPEWARAIAI